MLKDRLAFGKFFDVFQMAGYQHFHLVAGNFIRLFALDQNLVNFAGIHVAN